MRRALIVEDDRVWAEILRRAAEREGFLTEVVASPQLAMDALDSSDAGQFGVIVVDMLLAAETGMALLNELAGYDDLAKIPVVVCTNSAAATSEILAPYNVRTLLDKATMTPDDVRRALWEAVS